MMRFFQPSKTVVYSATVLLASVNIISAHPILRDLYAGLSKTSNHNEDVVRYNLILGAVFSLAVVGVALLTAGVLYVCEEQKVSDKDSDEDSDEHIPDYLQPFVSKLQTETKLLKRQMKELQEKVGALESKPTKAPRK